ncbi:MAG: hypothetical protein HN348_15885 [Proteobacteria bacterium]|nr:hypothetical protein [Pseudomonadota bacterium]
MSLLRVTLLVPVFLSIACKNEQRFVEVEGEDIWHQSENNEVDILWVIDNTNSMTEEQSILSGGFDKFIAEIESTGTDFHLGVITTSFETGDTERGKLLGDPPVITSDDDYMNLFANRVQVGFEGSNKEKGLEAAVYALSPVMTTGYNTGFLRPEAELLVVIVSDEDDCSDNGALDGEHQRLCYTERDRLTPVSAFVSDLRELKSSADMARFSAIVGPAEYGQCDDTWPGTRYLEAVALTDGQKGDICLPDWTDMLFELGLDAAGIRTSFLLTHPALPGSLEVWVDNDPVSEDAENGWTYDLETTSLLFHGPAIPERGSRIRCTYDIMF